MNNVVLIGRLARDPELRYPQGSDLAITKFTLAVDRPRKNGEDQGADFIRITAFGKQAETCDKYLSKGRQAAVMGRIQTGSYKNSDGVTIYTTDVIAERVEFLGGGRGDGEKAGERKPSGKSGGSKDADLSLFDDLPDSFEAAEDDIPF